ncbi:hypothetical protein BHE74_00032610 [Ensete ventricosum]|nr:hypothetical protein BHE74_00032610 [Ensete ventricosum]
MLASTSLVWQPSRSTSSTLATAIAGIDDTIDFSVAYYRLIIRSLLQPSQQQPNHLSSSVQIPLCIYILSLRHHRLLILLPPLPILSTSHSQHLLAIGVHNAPADVDSCYLSSVEVNRRQTFTAVDNTAVSLTLVQDLHPLHEFDLVEA